MSDAVFPTLKGIAWPVKKNPMFKTLIQTPVSGKNEKRIALMSYPRWDIRLPLEFAIDDNTTTGDYQALLGFFLARYGSFDDFLFLDANDHTFTDQVFGVGDGITRTFQLVRSYANFIEPILGILAAPTIKVAGAPTTAFTNTTKGSATFTVAPAIGASLTASGAFYYRVRFNVDNTDLQEEMSKMWSSQEIPLITVK